MAAIAMLALLISSGLHAGSPSAQFVDVDLRVSAGTAAQISWSDDVDFSETRSARVPLQQTEGFQQVRFGMPRHSARWLRFDPMNGPGDAWIRTIRLRDADGRQAAVLDPKRWHPFNEIASIARDGDVTHLVTTPGAVGASLLIPLPVNHDGMSGLVSIVTPFSLGVATAIMVALMLGCIVSIGRRVFGRDADVGLSRWQIGAWLAALFLVVFSASLLLLRQNPVNVPFWDQWDLEARTLYVPYHEGGLTWRMMFSSANEHRIFFTRLLALDLLTMNGQWDPRLQQVADAGLHAFTAVVLVATLWFSCQRRRLDLLVLIGVLAFAPPIAWENVLLAIQSAAYLVVMFSVLAMSLVALSTWRTAGWFLGWGCAACALVSFGSGIAVPVAIMGMAILKWIGARQSWRELVANLVVGGSLVALSLATRPPPVPGHAQLAVQTVGAFAVAVAHYLSWPRVYDWWPSLVMWVPVAWLLISVILRRGATTVVERLVIGLVIWVALHAVAIAYGRGASPVPSPRYLDYLSLGFVANAMAVVAAMDRAPGRALVRPMLRATTAVWLVWVSVGVDTSVVRTLNDLTTWRQWFANQVTSVRTVIASGDVSNFLKQAPLVQLPYPDPTRLTTVLQDDYIRGILPPAVRAPLRVEPRTVTNDAFVLQAPDRGLPYDVLSRAWWSLGDEGKRTVVGRFESEPLRCNSTSQLRFEVAGYLGWPDQYLALREQGTRDRAISPSVLAGEQWADVILRCPAGPFTIVAIDQAADSWFAFREPVEIGRASRFVEWLIRRSRGMLFVSLALTVLLVRWTIPAS